MRWMILKEDKGLWREILASRYGVVVEGLTKLDTNEGIRKGSGWWKGICRLGRINKFEDWFYMRLKRKLG